MLAKKIWIVLLLLLLPGLFVACSSVRRDTQLQKKHPDSAYLGGYKPTVCTDCHDSQDETFGWEQFNHTTYFGEQHKQQAYRNEQVCSMCHQRNFCSDCHATRVELKPSLKNQSDTFRRMPHRGDYLARHRIDGRVDPTSCIRCHSNPKSAESCIKCHS